MAVDLIDVRLPLLRLCCRLAGRSLERNYGNRLIDRQPRYLPPTAYRGFQEDLPCLLLPVRQAPALLRL